MDAEILTGLAPVIDSQTKVLILGSMPGAESLRKEQYYANKRNHFWKIMTQLLKEELSESYAERIALLQNHHIGLWDVIHSCKRVGSLDSAITEAIPNDFGAFFQKYPAIQVIGLNGNKSFQTFRKQVGFAHFPHLEFVKLPSTSPVPGKNVKTFEEKVVEWENLFK